MATIGDIVDTAGRKNFSKWWLPICAGILSLIVGTSILISSAFDLGEIAYIFLGVPFITLVVSIFVFLAARRSRNTPSLPVFLTLPAYWAVTWILFVNRTDVRENVRWTLDAREYKADMMKQPEPPKGELRHIEWDGWGWAGMDTYVYLVFDPTNSLAQPAKTHSAGKFSGIPCPAPQVRHLERDWYYVVFYTDATWSQCT